MGQTRRRIVDAALLTLKEDGYAGTSARAIARRGGFNQALIFYHFGTLNDLLLAALDETSAQRMRRYRAELETVRSLDEKIRVATELYREDLEAGHITVISELLAASLGRPDLAAEVVTRVEPWVALVEDVLREALAGSPLENLVPARAAATTVVAVYLGLDLLAHLDRDLARAEAVFEMGGRLAGALLPALVQSSAPPGKS